MSWNRIVFLTTLSFRNIPLRPDECSPASLTDGGWWNLLWQTEREKHHTLLQYQFVMWLNNSKCYNYYFCSSQWYWSIARFCILLILTTHSVSVLHDTAVSAVLALGSKVPWGGHGMRDDGVNQNRKRLIVWMNGRSTENLPVRLGATVNTRVGKTLWFILWG